MQDGAELLAGQLADGADLQRGRLHEVATQGHADIGAWAIRRARGIMCTRCASSPALASASMTGPTSVLCSRVAHFELLQGTGQDLQHPRRDLFLQVEHPQGGAALAGALEGGAHHIAHHLLRQGGGVDNHGVLAAGLGDERQDGALALGQGHVDELGGLGGAGEADAADAGIRRQLGADGGAVTRQQLQHVARNASLMGQGHRQVGDETGLLGTGLAMTVLPVASAAATCPRKIASGKFHGLMQTNTPRPCRNSSFISPV